MLFVSICQRNEWSLSCLYKGEGELLEYPWRVHQHPYLGENVGQ